VFEVAAVVLLGIFLVANGTGLQKLRTSSRRGASAGGASSSSGLGY